MRCIHDLMDTLYIYNHQTMDNVAEKSDTFNYSLLQVS